MVIDTERKVYIPHLNYTVYLLDSSKANGRAREMLDQGYIAIAQRVNGMESIIYASLPLYDEDIPILCHEITHVIQYICRYYGISLIREQEHIAYLFQYLLDEFMK